MKQLIKKNPFVYHCALKINEWLSYFFDIIKPSSSTQVKLIIFGQGRTGSTLLESLICSTGYFYMNGELLNSANSEIKYPFHYIRGLSKRRSMKNFIFHVKIYQLTRDRKRPVDPAAFLNSFYTDGWKIIYLRRRNKIRHTLSKLVAEHRGDYHKFKDNEEIIKISINCDDFVRKVKERFMYDEAEKKAIANIKYHEVVYEDDLEKSDMHQETIDRILEYVFLEHRVTYTKHKKINTQSLRDLIVNYNEFVECLNKQEWSEFIE